MRPAPSTSIEITREGLCLGHILIADESGKSSIVDEVAEESGGLVQLLEDHAYEFAFLPSEHATQVRPLFSSPFMPNRLAVAGIAGRLPSSRFVGTINLPFAVVDTGKIAFTIAIEVRPRKLEYLTEFYQMLNDLSAVALDLVTTLRSSFNTSLRSNEDQRSESIQQQLMFLRSICEGQQVFAALNQIQSFPQTALMKRWSSQPISRSIVQSRQMADSFARQTDRAQLPESHPLAKRIRSVPRNISTMVTHETLDTVENRFVKFAIRSISEFISDAIISLRKTNGADRSLLRWLESANNLFREVLSQSFFSSVGALQVLPLGSPSLQRRHGYKQVLDVWLRFNSANRLSWRALDEVFSGGQRDAALLYEYWCFFVLREAMVEAFEIEKEDLSRVLRSSDDKLSITLKSGEEAAVVSSFKYSGDSFGICLSYQKSFGLGEFTRDGRYTHGTSNSGTWSKRMDPDFTISIWPISDEEASDGGTANCLMKAHLLFDAKYRVVVAAEGKGDRKERLRAKGDDLDKMHAYLGSIRASVGSYAIFPGDVTEFFCSSDALLPSVGYIGVRPGDSGTGKENLRQHLLGSMECLYETWSKCAQDGAKASNGSTAEDNALGQESGYPTGAGHQGGVA